MTHPDIYYLMDIRIQTTDPIICSKSHNADTIFDSLFQSINDSQKISFDLICTHIEQTDFECEIFFTVETPQLPFQDIRKIVETYTDTDIQVLYAGSQADVPYPTHMGKWVYRSLDFAWKDEPIHVQAASKDMQEQYPDIFEDLDLLFGTW